MAKIDFDADGYMKAIESLSADTEEIVKSAIYKGANVVANAIRQNIQAIPIQEGDNGLPPVARDGEKLYGISRRQKADLLAGFGLAPMEESGDFLNTKAGFDGYGSVKTKKYPKGVPNAMLMRSVESGTSFREKHPTVRPAVNKTRKQAQKIMEEEIDRQIRQRME